MPPTDEASAVCPCPLEISSIIMTALGASGARWTGGGRGSARWVGGARGGPGEVGGSPRRRPFAERVKIWGEGRKDDVAQWVPRIRKGNRGTAGAICVLRMKIFLLHPQ
jgi:hypothetical protein